MRTISSFTLVGTLLPPRKAGLPLLRPLFAGKIPACSSAVEFGSIMQVGITKFPLPSVGKGLPWVIPAGAALLGQFLNRNDAVTLAALGTLIGRLEGKVPPYHAVSGTVCVKVCP